MRVANQALFGASRQAWDGGQLATIPGVSEDVFADRMLCGNAPNMPHSRMTPTPPLRPTHPWPGVARGLGARVKGHVLPDSPKSAPLTGGRFRRPAKTHEGTPSGAHFSGHCQAWRPAGGTKGVPGRRLRVREPPCVTGCGRAGPIRVRGRRLRDAPAGGDAPRGRAGRCRANGRPSNTARAARPMTGHRAEPVADVTPPRMWARRGKASDTLRP